MHPKVEALIAERRATGWPTKRGIHASDQAYDTAEWHKAQFGRWKECGFHAVKLMAATDSQVNTIIAANVVHFTPYWIIRCYANQAPNDNLDPRVIKLYTDRGVQFIESTANEFYAPYENVWGGSMPRDWPAQIARQFGKQAEAILSCGAVPITPAIETWRFIDIFCPLFDELIAHYPDVLRQSVMGLHNRTLNHPIMYDQDPGGYRGWEDCDDYVYKRLGEHMPIIGTEAGPEPLWDMDRTYPQISVDMHAQMVKDLLRYETPDYYLFDCLWEWKGRGAFERASYIESPLMAGRGDLPVVRMLATWRPEALTPALGDEYIRQVGKARPSQVSLNPGAALYKAAAASGLGQAETSEWEQDGWVWQKFQWGVVACPAGKYDAVRVVRWT